jgi:hypothetical protein
VKEERHPRWGDNTLDEVVCVRCGEARDAMDVDRLLWCKSCRVRARNEAGWWGWAIGLGFGAVVAAYVWLVIRPTDLVIGGWIATVVAAVWIGAKIGREAAFGVMRGRRSPGTHGGGSPQEP